MPGKRRSRLDRILPEASLDSSPAGGSVPSASPRAPPPSSPPSPSAPGEDPLDPRGVSRSGNAAPTTWDSSLAASRTPHPLPDHRSLFIPDFFSHPFYLFPNAPFLLKSTTEQGQQSSGTGGKNNPDQTAEAPARCCRAQEPPQSHPRPKTQIAGVAPDSPSVSAPVPRRRCHRLPPPATAARTSGWAGRQRAGRLWSCHRWRAPSLSLRTGDRGSRTLRPR